MRKSATVFLAAASLMAATGCATIAHSTRQVVHVTSDPPGAQVTVLTAAPGKPEIVRTPHAGVTPVDLSLTRRDAHIVIRFSQDGCQAIDIALKRTTSGWVWGNAILANPFAGQGADSATGAGTIYAGQAAAIAGALVVDFASGGAYKLPKSVHVTLCE